MGDFTLQPPQLIIDILDMNDPYGSSYNTYTSGNFDTRAKNAGLHVRSSSQLALFIDDLLPNKIYRISGCITSWEDYTGWNTIASDETQKLLIDKYNRLLDLYIIAWKEYYYLRPSGLVEYRREYIYPDDSDNRKPFTPLGLWPNDVGVFDLDIDLSWSGGDPDENTIEYWVYFDNATPPAYKGVTFNTTYDVGTMNAGTTYYWKVISREYLGVDSYGLSSMSEIVSFSTAP